MTSETRTAIEPKDISGFEIECANCGVRTFYPLMEANNYVGPKCQSGLCMVPDFFQHDSQQHKELLALVNLLGRYAHSKGKEKFVLRLELKPSNSQTSIQAR